MDSLRFGLMCHGDDLVNHQLGSVTVGDCVMWFELLRSLGRAIMIFTLRNLENDGMVAYVGF